MSGFFTVGVGSCCWADSRGRMRVLSCLMAGHRVSPLTRSGCQGHSKCEMEESQEVIAKSETVGN